MKTSSFFLPPISVKTELRNTFRWKNLLSVSIKFCLGASNLNKVIVALICAFLSSYGLKKWQKSLVFFISNWVNIVNCDRETVTFVQKVFFLNRLRAQIGLIHCNSGSRSVGAPKCVFLEVLGTKKKTLFLIEKKVLFKIFQQDCFSQKRLLNFSLSWTMFFPTCFWELRTSKDCWLNFEGMIFPNYKSM